MKKLIKKLRASSGLTLIETLAAAVILTLLCLALNSGMNIAVHAYRSVIAESETQLLLSTAADALTQELRYAEPTYIEDGRLIEYTSAQYGLNAKIEIEEDGRLAVNGVPILSTGVYKGGAYKLSFVGPTGGSDGGIDYDPNTELFTFTLRAEQEDLAFAEQEFTVRCLNGGTT